MILPGQHRSVGTWKWIGLLATLPTPAAANGAMSLALTIFEWRTWLVYVGATVLFEAWLFGKLFRVPWPKAFARSVGANLLTGLLGASCLGIFTYGSPWNRLNPNPFVQTVALFVGYGLLSALVEAAIWRGATKLPLTNRQITLRSLTVHLLGVPLGLSILLLPARPYRGLEMQVAANREAYLRPLILRALNQRIAEHGRLPAVKSYEEALEVLRPELGWAAREPDLWAAAYLPRYQRFDTGEAKRGPRMEWNTHLATVTDFLNHPPSPTWVCRIAYEDGFQNGLVWNGSGIERTADPVALGYATKPSAEDKGNATTSGAR